MIRKFLLLALLLTGLSSPLHALERASLLSRLNQLETAPPDLIAGIKTAPEQELEHYLTWLNWLEREPQKLGRVSYVNEPLVAGSRRSIQVTYRIGTTIQPGGRLLLATHWRDGIVLQSSNPQADNYIRLILGQSVGQTVGESAGQISGAGLETGLNSIVTQLKGPFGGLLNGRAVAAFEISGGALQVGENVKFELRNLVLPGRAGAFFLPVFFTTRPNQPWFAAPQVELSVRPDRLANVEVIAPSRLGRAESVPLKVILQDQFGNTVSDSLPTLDVLVDGQFLQQLKPTTAISSVEGIQFTEPGAHSIEVRTGGGGIRGRSNPIVVQSGGREVLWADLRSLSAESPSLDYSQTATPDNLLLQRLWQSMPSNSHWVWNGGLLGGGSRLVLGDWNRATHWRDLPNVPQVALPFSPVDLRSVDASRLQLVEIVSGDSVYEWYANRFFQAGYRLGLTGSASGGLPPIGPKPRSALTAVVVDDGQNISSALRQRSTYATTGNRPVIHATVNGAQPGRRMGASKSRSINGWVQGTYGIERIELIKNGELIETINVAGDPQSKTLKVTMRSSSEPYLGQRDLPRNGREWIGFVQLSQTTISDLAAPGFRIPARQAIAKNGVARADFITWTHGSSSSFMLTLPSLAEDDVIELNLKQGHEDIDIEPLLRQASPIPANRQMVPVFDLGRGPVTRQVKVNGYQDQIRFELVNPDAPSYVEFSFSDNSPTAKEDYYYLRVHQLDDHIAWTSPVFVGGFDAP
ncbi:MAG: hypothetical protein ACI82A_004142 [Candidatus Azotimanducaceae bacterium]